MEVIKINRRERKNIIRKKTLAKTLRYLEKTLMFTVCGILTLVIITSCIIMFDSAIHPGKTPSIFGFKAMTVLTGSMSPEINPGDLVIVKNIKESNTLTVGDTVTYKNRDNILITHRVLEVNNSDGLKTYITKGDANPVADVEPVTQGQLEGTYITQIPYLGYIGMFVKTSTGIILLVVIPMLLIFGIEVRSHFKKSKVKTA